MAKSRSSSSGSKSRSKAGTSRSASARGRSKGGARSGGGGTRSRTARTSTTASRTAAAGSKAGGGRAGGAGGTGGRGGGGGGGGGAGTQMTTDHEQIRQWVESRGGRPACVRGTGGGDDIGVLRIDFPGYSGGESLQPISWDDFFEKFDERNLALLYQETTSGGQRSNFNKLVDRNEAAARSKGGRGR